MKAQIHEKLGQSRQFLVGLERGVTTDKDAEVSKNQPNHKILCEMLRNLKFT